MKVNSGDAVEGGGSGLELGLGLRFCGEGGRG